VRPFAKIIFLKYGLLVLERDADTKPSEILINFASFSYAIFLLRFLVYHHCSKNLFFMERRKLALLYREECISMHFTAFILFCRVDHRQEST
jgi:hypothetical protein